MFGYKKQGSIFPCFKTANLLYLYVSTNVSAIITDGQRGFLSSNRRADFWHTAEADQRKIFNGCLQSIQSVGYSLRRKKNLIKFTDDANDRRKRLVDFTVKGSRLIPTLKPIWESMTKAMQNLLTEGQDSVNLLATLSQLEDSIEKESLYERIIREVKKTQLGDITVSPYGPADEGPFKNLILSWLIHNNEATVSDSDLINQPEVKIQKEDALILMAKSQELCIGTIVVQVNNGRAEIVYLVVDEPWQRRQIGKKLVQEAVQNLKNRHIHHIRVQLDRRMSHAIKLFKDTGFLLQSVTSNETNRESEGGTLHMNLHLK